MADKCNCIPRRARLADHIKKRFLHCKIPWCSFLMSLVLVDSNAANITGLFSRATHIHSYTVGSESQLQILFLNSYLGLLLCIWRIPYIRIKTMLPISHPKPPVSIYYSPEDSRVKSK
uniref:Uncharacterized protein n=1 Tax=Opuntia streptacantha TaxID=393608 RepID=A0A7C9F5Q4_OPUST